MGLLFVVGGVIGWLLGVWLPWWAIGVVLSGIIAFMARSETCSGGLESIPPAIFLSCICFFMVVVGFAMGDVTIAELFGFARVAFTGNQ